MEPAMERIGWITVLLSLLLVSDLRAQGFTTSDFTDRKHRDFVGKPCLESAGSAKPLVSNPRVFDHIVSLENHCTEPIKAKICYRDFDSCTEVDVPAHSRTEQVIGIFPAIQQFRYDVKERF
jgi:hypothetical protein